MVKLMNSAGSFGSIFAGSDAETRWYACCTPVNRYEIYELQFSFLFGFFIIVELRFRAVEMAVKLFFTNCKVVLDESLLFS